MAIFKRIKRIADIFEFKLGQVEVQESPAGTLK